MIVLLDCIRDLFQFRRRMIELTRDLDLQFRVPRDRVIVDRQAAIGRDELAIFGQNQRIDFERTRFDVARRGKQFSNRVTELPGLLGRETAGLRCFFHFRIERTVVRVAGDAPGRRRTLFDSSAAAGREDDDGRAGRVIDREGKKKLAIDRNLFFHEHGLDRKLADRHRQHSLGMGARFFRFLRKGDAADPGATRRPGLDLDYDLAAKLLCGGDGFIRRVGSLSARSLEPVGAENFLPLIFVQSSHAAISTIPANFQRLCRKEIGAWRRFTPAKARTTSTL